MNGHKRPTIPIAEFTGEAITLVAMHQVYRDDYGPTSTGSNTGSRLTLYIK